MGAVPRTWIQAVCLPSKFLFITDPLLCPSKFSTLHLWTEKRRKELEMGYYNMGCGEVRMRSSSGDTGGWIWGQVISAYLWFYFKTWEAKNCVVSKLSAAPKPYYFNVIKIVIYLAGISVSYCAFFLCVWNSSSEV